jgi:hypothetical protein
MNSGFAEQTRLFVDDKLIHNSGFAEQPHRWRRNARARR